MESDEVYGKVLKMLAGICDEDGTTVFRFALDQRVARARPDLPLKGPQDAEPKEITAETVAAGIIDRLVEADALAPVEGAQGKAFRIKAAVVKNLAYVEMLPDEKLTAILSPAQLAKAFNRSWATVRRLLKDGTLPYKKLSEKMYRIPIDEMPPDWEEQLNR